MSRNINLSASFVYQQRYLITVSLSVDEGVICIKFDRFSDRAFFSVRIETSGDLSTSTATYFLRYYQHLYPELIEAFESEIIGQEN